MRPANPTVIAEGRLMVETRATADGVRVYLGEEEDGGGLAVYEGVLPPDVADAVGHALIAKANVARALVAARLQPDLPGVGA